MIGVTCTGQVVRWHQHCLVHGAVTHKLVGTSGRSGPCWSVRPQRSPAAGRTRPAGSSFVASASRSARWLPEPGTARGRRAHAGRSRQPDLRRFLTRNLPPTFPGSSAVPCLSHTFFCGRSHCVRPSGTPATAHVEGCGSPASREGEQPAGRRRPRVLLHTVVVSSVFVGVFCLLSAFKRAEKQLTVFD